MLDVVSGGGKPEYRAFVIVGSTLWSFVISGRVAWPVLPGPVQAIGLVTPLTWWIEGIRLALFPGGVSAIGGAGSLFGQWTGTAAPSATTIILVLLATGSVATLGPLAMFRVSDRRAKDRGLFDQTTGS